MPVMAKLHLPSQSGNGIAVQKTKNKMAHLLKVERQDHWKSQRWLQKVQQNQDHKKKTKNEEEPEMVTDPPPDGPKGPPGPPGPPPDPTGGGAAVVATAVEAKAVDNRS